LTASRRAVLATLSALVLPALRGQPAAARRLRWKGGGSLRLRLEAVDVEDVFAVLHHHTGAAFVVSDVLPGPVSVDLDQVSLEQALEALASFGIAITARGAVRMVQREAAPAPGEGVPDGGGEPVSLWSKRWPIERLAGLLGELEGRPVLVPSGELGRVSVFAADVPRAALFEAVFAMAGLSQRIEQGSVVLQWRIAGAGSGQRPLPRWRGDPPTPRHLAATPLNALRLVGLSRASGEWIAWAYAPDRAVCWPLVAGVRLQDGEITRVASDHLLFEGVRAGSVLDEPTRYRARLALPGVPAGR
jgi:hypothetical protein